MAYADDQTAIFLINIAQIHLPDSIFLAVIFTSNCHNDVMITPPQQASFELKSEIDIEIFLRPANRILRSYL